MAVGLYSTKSDVDSRAGHMVQAVRDALAAVANFKLWLDGQTDVVLEAAPYGYPAGDVATLRSTFDDMNELHQIYLGLATLAQAKDFRTFAKLLG